MLLSERNLGLLVGRARKTLRREFEARLVATDLTVPQVAVLVSLWEEDGRTISQLSSNLCSDGPTLTSLLDRMEAKGLIHRERDVHDRRVIRIYLKEHGRAIQDEVMSAGDQVLSLAKKGMTQEQLDHLCDLLELLCSTMEGVSENRTTHL